MLEFQGINLCLFRNERVRSHWQGVEVEVNEFKMYKTKGTKKAG